MALKDLSEIGQSAAEKSERFGQPELSLPASFTGGFKRTFEADNPGAEISFVAHTALYTSKTGLKLPIPNQWFFTASFFVDLVKELNDYTHHFERIFQGDDRKKIAETSKIEGRVTAEVEAKINGGFAEPTDREFFTRFLTDYPWWRGGKTIDRGDIVHSPVLAFAGVVNNSSAFLAEIAEHLSRHDDLNDILVRFVAAESGNKRILVADSVLKNFIRRLFIYLQESNNFEPIQNLLTPNDDPRFESARLDDLSLTSIFWIFDHEATEEELKMGGKLRTFPEPLNIVGGTYRYLSGEWTDNAEGRLDFTVLRKIFNRVFKGHFNLAKENGRYVLARSFNHPLNQILYGPPGTGKTFNVLNHSVAIICEKSLAELAAEESSRPKITALFNELVDLGRIRFITFHQTYAYEEFIEGIRSKVVDRNVIYEVDDGVFKKFCDDASKDLTNNYVFIIDEINRGNISKIFGELITLIEPSKRSGMPEELYARLAYSGTDNAIPPFSVPQNVYIIGTMNSADRSIALIDTALRRRFTFLEYAPDASLLSGDIEGINLQTLLNTINDRIEILLDKDHRIGHAYLMGISSAEELAEVFRNQIIPLLEEYFFADFEKIQYVLGDNSEWGKPEARKLVQMKAGQDHRKLFGTEIDGFEERTVFRLNHDLETQSFSRLGSDVFKSIYLKPGTAKSVEAEVVFGNEADGDPVGKPVETAEDV